MSIRFQWNPRKAELNAKKHGVNFFEAVTVFQDPLAYIFADEAHSEEEYRELIIGYSKQNHLLIVSFTECNDVFRIISVRKADREERQSYDKARR